MFSVSGAELTPNRTYSVLEQGEQCAACHQGDPSEHAKNAVMLSKVEELAFDLETGNLSPVRRKPCIGFRAFPANMHHFRVRVINDIPARLAGPPAVIHLFIVEEKSGVE